MPCYKYLLIEDAKYCKILIILIIWMIDILAIFLELVSVRYYGSELLYFSKKGTQLPSCNFF